jgi:hypothetical protein
MTTVKNDWLQREKATERWQLLGVLSVLYDYTRDEEPSLNVSRFGLLQLLFSWKKWGQSGRQQDVRDNPRFKPLTQDSLLFFRYFVQFWKFHFPFCSTYWKDPFSASMKKWISALLQQQQQPRSIVPSLHYLLEKHSSAVKKQWRNNQGNAC